MEVAIGDSGWEAAAVALVVVVGVLADSPVAVDLAAGVVHPEVGKNLV